MSAKSLLQQITKIVLLNSRKIILKTPKEFTKSTRSLLAVNIQGNITRQYSSGVINNIPIVTYEEVKKLPQQPEKLLIDVREPNELQETGQIPTSINIPLAQVVEELSAKLDKAAFKAKYGREKPEKNTEVIFHCKIGKRSQSAAELARSLGYTNSKNYIGSWTEWAEKEGLNK